jgi:hypothetical protein
MLAVNTSFIVHLDNIGRCSAEDAMTKIGTDSAISLARTIQATRALSPLDNYNKELLDMPPVFSSMSPQLRSKRIKH